MKIALLATGFIAHNHAAEILKIPGLDLVGVVDQDREKGEKFASDYKTKYFSSFDDLLKEESVDIADICLPTNLHKEYTLKCAEKGIHVLCEKHMTLRHEDGEEMIDACKKNGVKLMVAHVLRFWPEYQVIKEVYDSGELGRIGLGHLARLSSMPAWSKFYDTPEISGGGLYDIQLHDVDYCCYLFGKVAKVYALGYQNKKGAWNNLNTSLKFENGANISIAACQEMSENYPFTMHLRLLGDKGTIEFSHIARQLLRGEVPHVPATC